jgi:hypothetical protein
MTSFDIMRRRGRAVSSVLVVALALIAASLFIAPGQTIDVPASLVEVDPYGEVSHEETAIECSSPSLMGNHVSPSHSIFVRVGARGVVAQYPQTTLPVLRL